VIQQFFAALVGTIAFSVLFSVPKEDYLATGLIGAVGWIVYYALAAAGLLSPAALFIATVVVVFLARYCAVAFQAPSTIFLIPGIFPLVPGGRIFWSVYHFMSGDTAAAASEGISAFKTAFVIVLGILVTLQLPGSLFKKLAPRKRDR